MKKWLIDTVTDTDGLVTIIGTTSNKNTSKAFRIVLRRNQAEPNNFQIHRGTVLTNDGCTANAAIRVASHLAATQQLRSGVSIVV